MYDVILLLIEEAEMFNKEGKNFSIPLSIAKQLPFFVCPNLIMKKECQKAIERYIYCSETSTPAYKGGYGEQPFKWIQMYFVLKQAFAQLEKQQIKEAK